MYEKIVEAMIFPTADILHKFINLIKLNLVYDNIVLDKNNILLIINPEITLCGMGRLLLIKIIRNIRVTVFIKLKISVDTLETKVPEGSCRPEV